MKTKHETNTLSKDKDFLLSSLIGKKIKAIIKNDNESYFGILKSITDGLMCIELDFYPSSIDNEEYDNGKFEYPSGLFFIPINNIAYITENDYGSDDEEEEDAEEEEEVVYAYRP